jgi:hypothetical protein
MNTVPPIVSLAPGNDLGHLQALRCVRARQPSGSTFKNAPMLIEKRSERLTRRQTSQTALERPVNGGPRFARQFFDRT